MRKISVITIIFAILLSACGQVKTSVPNTPQAKASQAILEEYISTNAAHDPDKLLSLYADDVVWMDYGMNDGPWDKADLDYYIGSGLSQDEIKVQFESYVMTPDGRFAAAQVRLSMKAASTGKWVTVPSSVVLEFKDGKIISETWYYDGNAYY